MLAVTWHHTILNTAGLYRNMFLAKAWLDSQYVIVLVINFFLFVFIYMQ